MDTQFGTRFWVTSFGLWSTKSHAWANFRPVSWVLVFPGFPVVADDKQFISRNYSEHFQIFKASLNVKSFFSMQLRCSPLFLFLFTEISKRAVQFSSAAHFVWLFATPWTAACQASLSITNARSLLKLMSIESVMPSNRFILCCPLLLLFSIFPSIRVFSNESAFRIRWPKYWSFNFSISPSNEYSILVSFRIYWFDLLINGEYSSLCNIYKSFWDIKKNYQYEVVPILAQNIFSA